ncbi:MAG: hypothetical protein ONB23_11555 [candidate division KSB1 bacterium]|nr:hypothetical protein [candidate division KSB1 bacterium]
MQWFRELVRRFVYGLLVLLLSLGIFYLASRNQGSERSRVVRVLEEVGQKAFSTIQDPEQRAQVAALFRDFLAKVRQGKADPQRVESVAAKALNLAYGSTRGAAGIEDLRRSLLAAQEGAPATRARVSQRGWEEAEKKIRAAEQAMAYWEARREAGDSVRVPMVRLADDLRIELDSALVVELQLLEGRRQELEAMRQERLRELQERLRVLDSLRSVIDSITCGAVADSGPEASGANRGSEP